MPFATDAYLADTKHLTTEEHGAYVLLLITTWRNNGRPLPDDPMRLARIVGATEKRWAERLRPVIAKFFDLSEGTWRQKRLEKEWAFVANRRASCAERGRKGGRPKPLEDNERGKAIGSSQLKPDESTHTHTHIKREKIEAGSNRSNSCPPSAGVAASPQECPQDTTGGVKRLGIKFPGAVDFSKVENRQAWARQKIAERIGLPEGTRLVLAASDSNAEGHAAAVKTCRRIARELKLSWQPPTGNAP
jgi:uncharacterized protein YdaU (DUF1376 family)